MYFLCVNCNLVFVIKCDLLFTGNFILLQYKKRQSFNCPFLLYRKKLFTYVY